jgi:soluble lytic murein transglycosylase
VKYKEEIVSIAQESGIEGGLIASVVNVESRFNEKALSNKGAIGIMQVLPSTAEWVAQKYKIEYEKDKLFDGGYNIKIGSLYLAYLIDYFQDEKLGVCAYNAGQGNVSNWLKDPNLSKDGSHLDKVPFAETRDYVAKVYKNYNYYKNRYR